MEQKRNGSSLFSRLDPVTVLVPLVLVGIFILWGQLGGDSLTQTMNVAFKVLTHQLGWIYLLFGFACVIASLWLAFGPYKHIKFGPDSSKPEFSNFAWYAMIFACGNGVGIMYWGAAEPLNFLASPPLHLEPGSYLAAEVGLAWAYFHWGWTPWAFYLVLTVPMGYFAYRRGRPLRYSSALPTALRGDGKSAASRIVDGILIFALVMGIITSLGLGIKQMAAGLNIRYDIASTATVFVLLGFLWVGVNIVANMVGLEKGLSRISDWNIYLALLLMCFVLVVGPTSYIFNMITNTFGTVISKFVTMSTWTDPVKQDGFPQGWTTFYWAWWLAWAPILSIFVSRISKGRTVKEIVLAHMVLAVSGSWLWFGVFGGTAINMALGSDPQLLPLLAEKGNDFVLYRILDNLPLSGVTSVIFMIVLFLFLSTTANASSYICAEMTTKVDCDPHNPPASSKAFWALVMGAVAIYLVIYSEGIAALQISSLLPSLLVIVFYFIAYYSFLKDVKVNEEKR